MNLIYTTYNIHPNSIDVYTHAGYFMRIDCSKAEDGLKTTPCPKCALNALEIEEPLLAVHFAAGLTTNSIKTYF